MPYGDLVDSSNDPNNSATPAPAEGTPPTPPAFAPPSYPPPAAPAYTGVPTYAPPVPRPAESTTGRTVAIAIGIIAACLLVLGGLGVAIFFVAQSAIQSFEENGIPELLPEDSGEIPEILPLVKGDAAEPVAVTPDECPTTCFSGVHVGQLVIDDEEFETLGVPTLVNAFGSYPESSPQAEFSYTFTTWTENDGTPAECFFTFFGVPVSLALDSTPEVSTDTIHYLEYRTSEDEYSGLNQSVRVFADSAAASAHMAAVHSGAATCSHYEMGKGRDFWEADVTPLPALELPNNVAATGWVESSDWSRYYVVDLQRGNLVLRSTLSTDGAITEEDYRAFIEDRATELAALAP
jgi:hypothetical protein